MSMTPEEAAAVAIALTALGFPPSPGAVDLDGRPVTAATVDDKRRPLHKWTTAARREALQIDADAL